MIKINKEMNVHYRGRVFSTFISETTNELSFLCGYDIILSWSEYRIFAYTVDGRPLNNKLREVSVPRLIVAIELKIEYEFIDHISYLDGDNNNVSFNNIVYSYRA